MIIIKEINLIIDSIPNILQYYLPGYWVIFLFGYLCSKKISGKIVHIMSCVLSYILLTFTAFLRINVDIISKLPDTALVNSGVAIAIGTLLILIFSMIFISNIFSKIMVKLFHKTPNDDIWRDVLDLKNGSNLKIYVKDADYYVIGHHKNHEEKDGEAWLAISAFAKFHKKSNTPYRDEPSYLDDENVIYTIRFSDIEHIEIF